MVFKKGVRGGVVVEEFKDIIEKDIKQLPLPSKVIIPLSQHTGKPARPLVEKDVVVGEGQLVAECDGFISANIHSSINGKVKGILDFNHPVLRRAKAIVIEAISDEERIWQEQNKINLDREYLISQIKKHGIVGLGGAAFPTHVKLSPPGEYKIDTLIINGCECEPYLSCDDVMMQTYPSEILKGIKVIAHILKAKNIIIAIEDNKKEAIEIFKEKIKDEVAIKVVPLRTKYPQGAEKQLIKVLLKREVPPGGLPFHVGVVVQNVSTCYAVYEAIYKDKPLIEKVITLSGDCLKKPGNYRVRIGTLLRDIVDIIDGFIKEPVKIIFGGPMMGIAQPGLDFPIVKACSGIVFLSQEMVKIEEERNCIRCARCVDVCPMNLLPTKIAMFVKKEDWTLVKEYHADDCIECGCCQFICPAHIPLTHLIRLGKKILLTKK